MIKRIIRLMERCAGVDEVMSVPKTSLTDRLKDADKNMIELLRHKSGNCVWVYVGECVRQADGTYSKAFPFLTTAYGGLTRVELCYKECQRHANNIGWKR